MRALPRPARLLLAAVIWTLACTPAGGSRGPDAGAAPPLLVLAASGLREALEELAPLYEARSGGEVDLVLGSSGHLSTQILNGAPADVFIAADGAFVDPLEGAGLVVEASRRVVGVGRVALVWRDGLPAPGGVEVLGDAGNSTVSMANPEVAPYGSAARDILRAVGLQDSMEGRIVMGENVSQALQFVESGNADYGLVALSLVQGTRPREHLVLPDDDHRALAQVAVVLRTGSRPAEGEAFLDVLRSPEGQAILERYGIHPPLP